MSKPTPRFRWRTAKELMKMFGPNRERSSYLTITKEDARNAANVKIEKLAAEISKEKLVLKSALGIDADFIVQQAKLDDDCYRGTSETQRRCSKIVAGSPEEVFSAIHMINRKHDAIEDLKASLLAIELHQYDTLEVNAHNLVTVLRD